MANMITHLSVLLCCSARCAALAVVVGALLEAYGQASQRHHCQGKISGLRCMHGSDCSLLCQLHNVAFLRQNMWYACCIHVGHQVPA